MAEAVSCQSLAKEPLLHCQFSLTDNVMQANGIVAGFSPSSSVFAYDFFPLKLHAHPLIHLQSMLYNFSKLFSDMPQRTAYFATGRISSAVLHWVSYDLIEHGIAHIWVRLAEFSLFPTVTAFRKQKMVVGWGTLNTELTVCYTMANPVRVWFV